MFTCTNSGAQHLVIYYSVQDCQMCNLYIQQLGLFDISKTVFFNDSSLYEHLSLDPSSRKVFQKFRATSTYKLMDRDSNLVMHGRLSRLMENADGINAMVSYMQIKDMEEFIKLSVSTEILVGITVTNKLFMVSPKQSNLVVTIDYDLLEMYEQCLKAIYPDSYKDEYQRAMDTYAKLTSLRIQKTELCNFKVLGNRVYCVVGVTIPRRMLISEALGYGTSLTKEFVIQEYNLDNRTITNRYLDDNDLKESNINQYNDFMVTEEELLFTIGPAENSSQILGRFLRNENTYCKPKVLKNKVPDLFGPSGTQGVYSGHIIVGDWFFYTHYPEMAPIGKDRPINHGLFTYANKIVNADNLEFDFKSYVMDCVQRQNETYMLLRNDDRVDYYKFNATDYKSGPILVSTMEYPVSQDNMGLFRGINDLLYYYDFDKKALIFKEILSVHLD